MTTPNQASAQPTQDNRDELTRILVAATADGSLDAADKDYLAQIVANRTGLTPDAAQKRVNELKQKYGAKAIDNAAKLNPDDFPELLEWRDELEIRHDPKSTSPRTNRTDVRFGRWCGRR